jgi:aspartyl-tRNA(Asn)/glutamyl-tRNA(Gln) amidotransferase subunit C
MLPDAGAFKTAKCSESTAAGACPTRYHRRMAITRADVEHVAHLARLHLTDEELDRMETQLSRILEAIETLREVDTSHVGPTASVIQLENVMRDDVVSGPMPRDVTLANAPLRDDPFLRVPTVLEEGR